MNDPMPEPASALTATHRVAGIPVAVHNTRPDIDTGALVARLGRAIDLIDRYTPHYGRRMRRDFAGILVQRYPCRGAYLMDSRICLVELTFIVHETISEPQIAATSWRRLGARVAGGRAPYPAPPRCRHVWSQEPWCALRPGCGAWQSASCTRPGPLSLA
jgi:hypothetical protein